MKLARFVLPGGSVTTIGLVRDERVAPMNGIADLPQTMVDFFSMSAAVAAWEPDQWLPLSDVRLLSPVPRPAKFLGVGLNYDAHVRETGFEKPEYPTIFGKQSSCVAGPGDSVHVPALSDKVDYEGELGIVIGQRCHYVNKQQAPSVIAGFTIVNDVTVRDWQARSPTWTLGKSFDTHGPMGPYMVTPDEIDPHDVWITTLVNGEQRQHFHTADMLFDCYCLVEYISTAMTLEPGDVISTGTGPGVGVKMEPRGYLKPGDTVTIRIDHIGELSNPVIAEPVE